MQARKTRDSPPSAVCRARLACVPTFFGVSIAGSFCLLGRDERGLPSNGERNTERFSITLQSERTGGSET